MVRWKEARCRVGQVEGAGEAEKYVDVVGQMWLHFGFVRMEYYRKSVSGRVVTRERERRVDLVQANGCVGSDGEEMRRQAEVQGP